MRRLRAAFVGVKRPPSDVPAGYWPTFVRYHLELPFYYAAHAPIDVDLTTVESVDYRQDFPLQGSIRCLTESEFTNPDFDPIGQPYDVVVHWRRWHDDLYVPGARNVVLSQDHSYDARWLAEVGAAFKSCRLDGIMVFPTWHKENTTRELVGVVPRDRLYEGLTFGVDHHVYRPGMKDPKHLLWASDPGRGLDRLINPFLRLWAKDRSYHLTVTYPDYVKPESVARFSSFLKHPAVKHLPGVRNGPQLWGLFNDSGILPYSSNFLEPSSRCHRQAMSAGSLVLYPPHMGSPSYLIEDGRTGIVIEPEYWPDVIRSSVDSGRWAEIGFNARNLAVSESWEVQARRFYGFFVGS